MIYFDNSATTRPSEDILEAYLKISSDYFANPSSLHNFGGKAEQLITRAREQIAELVGVKPTEIIFTSGGSEGNNLAIKGTALQYKSRGNHLITTKVEHPSVTNPFLQLEKMGFTITWLPTDEKGVVNPADVEAAITDQTILVSIIHVNNEMGAIQPIAEIGDRLKKYHKLLFHVDHVQGAGKVLLNLNEASVDLCTYSSHKFHGLKGNGFLYKRTGVKLEPIISGGNQEQKMRSGTENTAGIVTTAKAFRLAELNRRNKSQNLIQIRNYIIQELEKHESIVLHSSYQGAPHIVNFSIRDLKGEVVVHALEEAGIVVSTTSACSSKDKIPSRTLLAMGVSEELALSAIRVSLSYENTMEEAKVFCKELTQIIDRLTNVVRRTR